MATVRNPKANTEITNIGRENALIENIREVMNSQGCKTAAIFYCRLHKVGLFNRERASALQDQEDKNEYVYRRIRWRRFPDR